MIYVRGGGWGGVTVNSFLCQKNWSHHTDHFINELVKSRQTDRPTDPHTDPQREIS